MDLDGSNPHRWDRWSGTNNYIPKFSGSNSIDNSNMQYGSEHGGNIGIGESPTGSDSKFIVSHLMAKGVDAPSYLAKYQTKTPLGAVTNQATISSNGDAYFKGNTYIEDH